MSEHFPSDFFANNRSRLRQLFSGTAPIVVTANGSLQKASDESYPFCQDASFWYLTGIDNPDVVLVMDKDKEYLIIPERTDVAEIFDGAIDKIELARHSGVREVMDENEGWKYFGSRLKRVRHVATLGANPKYLKTFGMYANPARSVLIRRLKTYNPDLELLDLRLHVARMRMIKQPVELEALQYAIDITMDTLKTISRPAQLSRYAYEYEVEADISRGFRRAGAQGHGFSPIVASGIRACTMHNITNNGKLASDELLLVDVSAQARHYVADISRTYSLGNASRRAEAVFNAVVEVQSFGLSLLKPGALLKENERQIEAFMGEKLRELGLIKSIEPGIVRKYYPHAASHFLGLDAHDAGDYEHPLEANVVLTMEPGIYIPEEAIGVRIEDDICITEDGYKILSERLPAQLS